MIPTPIKINPAHACSGLWINVFTTKKHVIPMNMIGVTGYPNVLYGRTISFLVCRNTKIDMAVNPKNIQSVNTT